MKENIPIQPPKRFEVPSWPCTHNPLTPRVCHFGMFESGGRPAKKGPAKNADIREIESSYNIRPINSLTYSSRLPASPPSTKWWRMREKPPLGQLILKGHRNLVHSLKYGPTV